MPNEFHPLQGMSDIALPNINRWHEVEEIAHKIFYNHGYSEIRTPILEKSDIFLHSLGDSSDIVQKEMYNLKDRGERSLVLRPEGTAGVVRYLASLGEESLGTRLYYLGPMFRCERPQAGRKRQFHQIGAEYCSDPNPYIDAECIALQCALLEKLGLGDSVININTLGSLNDRKNIQDRLKSYFDQYHDIISEENIKKIDKNVLRILDSKDKEIQKLLTNAPTIIEMIEEDSRDYLNQVTILLRKLDITNDIKINHRLVRGLDYYNNTVWEITHNRLGSQNAIAGGGRYSIKLGKRTINGIGFAMGIERILSAQDNLSKNIHEQRNNGYWIVSDNSSIIDNMRLAQRIRHIYRCGMDLEAKSIKSQLRKADRFNASYVVFRGEKEIDKNIVTIKDLDSGDQKEFGFNDWINNLIDKKYRSYDNASI